LRFYCIMPKLYLFLAFSLFFSSLGFQNVVFASEIVQPQSTISQQKEPILSDKIQAPAPRMLQGNLSGAIRSDTEIYNYLTSQKSVFGFTSPQNDLQILKKDIDKEGQTHYLLQQSYNGIPIYGKYIRAHLNTAQSIYAITNQSSSELNSLLLDTNPTINANQAIENLHKDIESAAGYSIQLGGNIGPRNLTEPTSALIVYPYQNQYLLAYQIDIEYINPTYNRWVGFVDAKTGVVIHKYSRLTEISADSASGTGMGYFGDSKTLNITRDSDGYYSLVDKSKPMYRIVNNQEDGVIATYDFMKPFTGPISSNTQTFNDPTAVDAHYFSSLVYDYYKQKLQRNSIDNKGMSIVSVVNVGAIDNAYWDGYEMMYGDGSHDFACLSCGLDVVAHELTHGITEYTAGLEYAGQPGALNESLSDIMAVVIDSDDWTIGEDIGVTQATYVLRDLKNPSRGLTAQPSHMNDYRNLPLDIQHDNGGVHINSGIPNHAAYLIGTGIEQIQGLNGQGKKLLGQIAYGAMTSYLTPTSDFADARDSFVLAAGDLTVTAEQKSSIIQVVKSAWAAVGLPYTNDENNIVSFYVPNMVGTPIIDNTAHTVDFTVTYSSCLNALAPNVFLSPGATIISGASSSQDFTSAVSYTIRSQSGLSQVWTIRGVAANAISFGDIISLSVNEQTGETLINPAAHTATFYVEGNTDISALIPYVEVSPGASVSPASGTRVNFTNPVTYTVTAQNGSIEQWTVRGIKDSTSPKLLGAESSSQTTINLYFNQAMNPNTINSIANYVVEPLISSAPAVQVSSLIVDNTASRVTLTVRNLTSEVAYKITVSGARSSSNIPLRPDRKVGYVLVGDTNPPNLLTAIVDNDQLVLTYDEYVRSYYTFNNGGFQIKANGNPISINNIAVNGRSITLYLAQKVRPIDSVSISYSQQPSSSVNDLNNNAALAFSNMPVINRTVVAQPVGEPNKFHINNSLKQIVKHPSKPVVYTIYKGDTHVVSADLVTGETKIVELDHPAERIFATEDEVVVALTHQPASLAILDGTDLRLKDEFQISNDPFDLVVDPNGIIYVSGGSGQWTNINSYSRVTKNVYDYANIRQASYLQISPTLSKIYAINTDVSPRDIQAFNVSDKGIFLEGHYFGGYDSPYHGDYAMTTLMRISPDGKYLFNGAGTIFTSTSQQSTDMRYVRTIDSFTDIAFDLGQDRFYTLKDNVLTTWKYSTFEKLGQIQLSQPVTNILSSGQANKLYLVSSELGGKRTLVTAYTIPGAATLNAINASSQSIASVNGCAAPVINKPPVIIPGGGGGGFFMPAGNSNPGSTQILDSDAIETKTIIDNQGKSILSVKPDTDKLMDAIQLALTGSIDEEKKNKQSSIPIVKMPIENFGNGIQVELPTQFFIEAAKQAPTAVISIQSGIISFVLPVRLLANLTSASGINNNTKDMKLNIIVEKPDSNLNDQIKSSMASEGYSPISDSIEFKISIVGNGSSEEITDFNGTYVTRSITIPGNVDASKISVLVFNPETNESTFIPAFARNVDGQTIVDITSPHNSIYTVVQASKTFNDIEQHWAKSDIELMASKKIVLGLTEQSFMPDKQITRAEFATILIRALGINVIEENSKFNDILATDWYVKSVNAAARVGLVLGYENGQFNPNGSISRQEMAVMIGRAMKYANTAQSIQSSGQDQSKINSFTDRGDVPSWASADIISLLNNGIMEGVTQNSFEPGSLVTRAQAVTVLKRMLQHLKFIN
jgi:Zn-dependent metalloprotease